MKTQVLCIVLLILLLGLAGCERQQRVNIVTEPYLLDVGLRSRSISFENPTGAPGQGGKAASHLGVGRKGAPSREIDPGQTVQLCDIEGPGTIRHIWIGGAKTPLDNRGIVIRAWWDDQEHPSIECPLGDLMGFAHGMNIPYYSIAHSTDPGGGRNIWLPMPFAKRAKIMLTNETPERKVVFYQIDYTIGDKHPAGVGRLHVLFRRENPTTLKQDFVLLPRRVGKGRFLGCVVGVRNLHPERWWGEGEIKIYLDGDKDYPTICGTFVGRLGLSIVRCPREGMVLQRLQPESQRFCIDVSLAHGGSDRLA